jgi:Tol biopolymer transport system component
MSRSPVRVGLRVCLALALLVLSVGCQNAAALAPGRIAWPKDGDLWVIDLPTKNQQKLTNLPRSAAVTGASWSPDGSKIVYAQFWRPPGAIASGADLFMSGADGGDAHLFVERDAPSTVLETPDWARSGSVYYGERRIQGGRESQMVARTTAEGAPPETIVNSGYFPSVSADESTIVFARSTQVGMELRKRALADPGDGCVLVPDTVFQAVGLPRISPDGKRVAFGGSGEPAGQPAACGAAASVSGPAEAGVADPAALRLAHWLDIVPTTADAHGLPYDVWTMSIDGGPLTKLADVKEDEPTVAWSPDGSHLAIFGVAALYMVDANGGPVQKVVDQGGYGALDWVK